jgi:dTDP-4-dehydrorhamnose reductase
MDLESIPSLVSLLERIHPDVVIHTAGLSSVERCESKPELARHVNVTLATNVAKACAFVGVKLVHISTDHLFSGLDSLVDEGHPVTPINVYGKTKAEAECAVLEINPQSLVIRTNFYGWGTSYRQSFSDNIINELRAGRVITLFQDVFYSPILIENVALAVHDLIDLNGSGIFNVVGDERISKFEFGIRIADHFDLDPHGISPCRLIDCENLVRRPHDMSLSNQKICSHLGRQLGGVDAHLSRLVQQQYDASINEMRNL